jgi:hypothetical protein
MAPLDGAQTMTDRRRVVCGAGLQARACRLTPHQKLKSTNKHENKRVPRYNAPNRLRSSAQVPYEPSFLCYTTGRLAGHIHDFFSPFGHDQRYSLRDLFPFKILNHMVCKGPVRKHFLSVGRRRKYLICLTYENRLPALRQSSVRKEGLHQSKSFIT